MSSPLFVRVCTLFELLDQLVVAARFRSPVLQAGSEQVFSCVSALLNEMPGESTLRDAVVELQGCLVRLPELAAEDSLNQLNQARHQVATEFGRNRSLMDMAGKWGDEIKEMLLHSHSTPDNPHRETPPCSSVHPIQPLLPPPQPKEGPDGPEAGRWLRWNGKRHEIPAGVVYRLIAFMWSKEWAGYDSLDGPVTDGEYLPSSLRSLVSKVNGVLRKTGVPWRLKTDSKARTLTKQLS